MRAAAQRWISAAVATCATLVGLAFALVDRLTPTAISATEVPEANNPFLAPASVDHGWPFLRGPNYDGRSAEIRLADSWPTTGPPVLWTRELGQGYSGFVAWQDRVATQYQTLAGQYVVCLQADSGETLWQYRYDWPYDTAGVYPGPRATPTYAKGRLYFAAPNGLIGCLDATDGRLLWSLNVTTKFNGEGTDFGYSCSPTVIDDKVLLPVGGRGASMVALDAQDGTVLWSAGDDAASYTPAYPIVFRGRQLVLGYLKNALVCHDLQTGERIWRRTLSGGYDEHSAWPIYREPYLWLSGPFRAGSELLELTGEAEKPLRTIWKSKLMSNDVASSVLVDGAIYGFDLRDAQAKTHRPTRGQFRCLDFLTGRENWKIDEADLERSLENSPDGTKTHVGHAALIEADGKLVLLNDTGELILARASPEQYEELARVSILGGEIGWTQPILHRGRLFVRNHSRAACVYLGQSDLLASNLRAASRTVSDIPQSPYVDWAAGILGVEPEYAFDIPSRRWLTEWFLISLLGVLGISAAATFGIRLLTGARQGPDGARWMFWTLAFVLGALGTTLISRWRGDFVFTWPVSLFVAFQAAVYQLRFKTTKNVQHHSIWQSRLIGLFLAASCLAYFLLCRRLSLVFEWAFLCGFGPALPVMLAGALMFRNRRWRVAWEILMTVAGFATFYGTAVVILLLKR